MSILQHVKQEGDGGWLLEIAVNEKFAGVRVDSITMYVGEDEEGGDGDLAVNWSTEGLENTGGGDMGVLIMRGDDDEVGEVMGEFYWQDGYTKRLAELLVAAGFSAEVADAVGTSEWGMQDEGRASYDAAEVAEAVREAMKVAA
jgi:hypothetical protein